MNAAIFIKKPPGWIKYCFKHQILMKSGENQSNGLFIRIEDNQYVGVFSRKILKSAKYHQIIR